MQQLVEIRLHGNLGATFGRVHHLAVESAAEALQALRVLHKGFEEALRSFSGPGFRVRIGDGAAAVWRDLSNMAMRIGNARRIDIVPVIHGRKRNGWGQVIVGAIIAVIGVYAENPEITKMGIMMMLGGAIALLTPMPKGSGSKAGQELNRSISGPVNVISSGGPVPLIIGRMLVGSVTISAGLSTDAVPISTVTAGAPELPPEEPRDGWDHGGDFGA